MSTFLRVGLPVLFVISDLTWKSTLEAGQQSALIYLARTPDLLYDCRPMDVIVSGVR
jgi:hypothetical protein